MVDNSSGFISSFVAFMFAIFSVQWLDETLNSYFDSYDFVDSVILGSVVFALANFFLKRFFAKWM